MGDYKNIEDYRRKKRLVGFLKKLLLLTVIAVILIILLNVLELFKGTNINELIGIGKIDESEQAFPVVIKNEQMVDFASFGSSIAVLTKANVLIYNASGKKTNSFIHGYTNPVMKENSKRVMTYDRGGNKLRVDTQTSSIGEIKTDFSILTAQISSNGNIAVVTAHDRYPCEVQVYDNNLKNLIYRYSATEEFSSVEFSKDEQYIYSTSITSVNGILSCNLYKLSTTKEVPAKVTPIRDVLPLAVTVSLGDVVKIVGTDCLISIDEKTGKQTRYSYKGDLQHFVDSSENETILMNKNPLNGYSTLSVISPQGTLSAMINVNDDIIDVYSDGSRIAVLCKSTVHNYDMKGKELNAIKLNKSMNKAVYNGAYLYVLGADSIVQFEVS